MKTENSILIQMAKESLKEKWGLAVGTFAVWLLLSIFINIIPFLGFIASLIISGPMSLGIAYFTLNISRNKEAKLDQIFKGFDNFGTALGAYLLVAIFTFLWSLLLIIPGIIASISYSMTFYILADNKSIGAMEALDKSKKMMDGYKMKFFLLMLRFFGIGLLCLLTLGIGFFWLIPFTNVTIAKFYEDINDSSQEKDLTDHLQTWDN